MNSYKSGSLSVFFFQSCVLPQELLFSIMLQGQLNLLPQNDDPSVVESVAEFVSVPSYSAWFQNVLWILDNEADRLLELVAYDKLEV